MPLTLVIHVKLHQSYFCARDNASARTDVAPSPDAILELNPLAGHLLWVEPGLPAGLVAPLPPLVAGGRLVQASHHLRG